MQSAQKFYFAEEAQPQPPQQPEIKPLTAPAEGQQPQAPLSGTGTQTGAVPKQLQSRPEPPPFWANPIFIMIPLMVFMLWWMSRSQKKQREERQKLLDSVRTGDKIVTIGGIHGIVANVKDKTLVVKIADNVKIEINRTGVESIVARGGEDDAKDSSKK
jgi:preprotein translocase subunit YajC